MEILVTHHPCHQHLVSRVHWFHWPYHHLVPVIVIMQYFVGWMLEGSTYFFLYSISLRILWQSCCKMKCTSTNISHSSKRPKHLNLHDLNKIYISLSRQIIGGSLLNSLCFILCKVSPIHKSYLTGTWKQSDVQIESKIGLWTILHS